MACCPLFLAAYMGLTPASTRTTNIESAPADFMGCWTDTPDLIVADAPSDAWFVIRKRRAAHEPQGKEQHSGRQQSR